MAFKESSVREYARIFRANLIDTEGVEVTVVYTEEAADEFIKKMTERERDGRLRPVVGIHVVFKEEPVTKIWSLNLCIDGFVLVYFEPQTLGPLLRSFLNNRVNIFTGAKIERVFGVLVETFGEDGIMSARVDMVERFIELYKNERIREAENLGTSLTTCALCCFHFDKERQMSAPEAYKLHIGPGGNFVTSCSREAYSAYRVGREQLGEEVLAVGIKWRFDIKSGYNDTKYEYDVTIGDDVVLSRFTCHDTTVDLWLSSILNETPSPRYIALAFGHEKLFDGSFHGAIETIQLFLHNTCYIIDLQKEQCPKKSKFIQQLLRNKDTTYFGIDIRSKLSRLQKELSLRGSLDDVKTVDLSNAAAAILGKPTLQGANLSELYRQVMGRYELLLPEVNLSSWDYTNALDDDLVRWATAEAVMCYQIGDKLRRMPLGNDFFSQW